MSYNLFLYFLVGIILNFMPCSLPLLSVKISTVFKYSYSTIKAKIAFFSISFGIMATFLVFSIFSIALKLIGKNFGFGMHLQNPYMLIVIMMLLVLLLITSSDFTENIYNGIYNLSNRKKLTNYNNIAVNSFISGILAVLFAMSCSFPLIGSAITLSLFENYTNIPIIFFFIALGMSSPFLLIAFFPKLSQYIPKNGKWSEYLIIFSNIVIILIIFWLLTILNQIIGLLPTAIVLGFLILLFFQSYIIKKPLFNLFVIISIFIAGTVLPINIFQEKEVLKIADTIWQNLNEKEIDQYVENDKTVFIVVVADWCAICNINQKTTFNKPKVVKRLQEKDIINIKVDITKENKHVQDFLENQNISGVPAYIIFNKKNPNGVKFSGLLTPNKFLKKLDNIMKF